MIDLPAFAVVRCPACRFDTLVGRELDDQDQWRFLCTRCDAELPAAALEAARSYDTDGLTVLGYEVSDGKKKKRGCGSGGCGCSTRA